MRWATRRVYDILAALAATLAALTTSTSRAQTAPAPAPVPTPAPAATTHPVGDWLRSAMPASLREVGFLLEHWQWLGLGAAIVLAAVVARLVAMITFLAGRRVFERFVPGSDGRPVRRMGAALGLLIGAGVAGVGFSALGLPTGVVTPLLVATSFVAATAAVLAVYRLVDLFTAPLVERARRTPSRYDDLFVPLLRKSMKIIVIAFGFVFIADNLDVDITSLLAGLGLGGLAFALAAQDTVKNLFGSITVLFDKPFQVGDAVNLGGVEGTVEEVGLRSTRIRTPSDSLVTVPNANLISSNVENLGARRWRRWRTRIAVGYDTPPESIEAFCEGVRELIRRHEETRKEEFEVWANEFGPSSIEILLSVYFRAATWDAELAARHRLLLDVMRLADNLEVRLAPPAQTLHLAQSSEPPRTVSTNQEASRKGPLPRAEEDTARKEPSPGHEEDAAREGRSPRGTVG